MAISRKNIPTQAPWESVVGYSRAVRVGPFVHVSGTAPIDERGEVVGPGDPHAQAVQALKIIEGALSAAGAALHDVVRTRIYVADINDWKKVGRAHAEFFHSVRPATTLIEVSRFVDPRILVEIEADAVILSSDAGHAAT